MQLLHSELSLWALCLLLLTYLDMNFVLRGTVYAIFLCYLLTSLHARYLTQKCKVQPLVGPEKGKKYAVVTGASSGIGREIALMLAEKGYSLVVVARRLELLKELAKEGERHGVKVVCIAKDLSTSTSAHELHAEISNQNLPVSILVNNAGYANLAAHLSTPPDVIEGMLGLMVNATTTLTRLFAADMVAKGEGIILQVSSVLDCCPNPYNAIYAACKSYLTSYSLALDYEIRPKGVTVTVLSPGATLTGFASAAHCEDSLIFKVPGMQLNARDVACVGLDAMFSGEGHVYVGWAYVLGALMGPFLPDRFMSFLMAMGWRPVGKRTVKNE